jgi:ABC-type multidrug transport system ATPase subunit
MQTAKSYYMAIGGVAPTIPAGMAIAPTLFIIFILFSGFLAPRSSMPYGWRWLNTISFETYAIKGLAVNEIYNLKWTCNPGETLIPELDTCQLVDGHDALRLYDMDVNQESDKWELTLDMFYFYLIFNAICYLGLTYLDWSQTDTSELPNFNQQEVRKAKSIVMVQQVEEPPHVTVTDKAGAPITATPATVVAVNDKKPSAVDISWNNLSYIVDIPKRKATPPTRGAPSSLEPSTAPVAAPLGGGVGITVVPEHKAIELAPIKESPTLDLLTIEQLVDDAPGKRTLLKDVYGYAKPGMMVALMGGSGAGKTTLLDVLAGKKTGGDIINDALVNGKLRDKSFNRIAGYVEQFDSHDESATVREAVEFSAMLRLSSNILYEDKMVRVDQVIRSLRLGHVQNQRIGSPESGGVSPEIRKKVTIAVELVMNPGLLFLDEPTTGLDSAGALAVMHAVRSLSKSITVICTIHQPSIEIVNCFSHVLLMNKWEQRGRVAYFGPVKEMPAYFGAHGLGQFQAGTNIAEFGLESLQQAGRSKINAASLFLQSNEGKQVIDDITNGIVPTGTTAPREYSTYAAGFVRQVIENTKRFFWNNARNGPLLGARYGVGIISALIGGVLYFHSAHTQKGAQNRISIMFLAASFPIFACMSFADIMPNFDCLSLAD